VRPGEQTPSPDDRAVSAAREHFLADPTEADVRVRGMILASWKRSHENDVGIDRLQVPYVREPDFDEPLCRSAAAVLDTLGEQLRDEAVSIILTDHTGLVIDRRSPDNEITRRLDEVRLAPGFSYAEEHAGTNGIGTSLSSGRATLVDGREHYSHELGQFSCAGAPIRHPTRGKTIGLLDLTAWSNAPGAMLSALAAATARQIELELLAQTGVRELALFAEYMKTRNQSSGPVLALNSDVIMTNSQLRQLLDSSEQEALISYAVDTVRAADRAAMRTVELPSGRSAHLRYAPVDCESGPAGGVFRIRLGHAAHPAGPGARVPGRSLPPAALAGLAGSGAVWARCVQQVDSCYQSRDWVALEGEPGAGKRAVLRAVHRVHNPAGRFRVIDAPGPQGFEAWLAALADDLSEPDALIVLSQGERLDDEQAVAFADLLVDAFAEPDHHARVAITLSSGAPTPLRTVFLRTVEVPALRHHIDDLAELVPHLLAQLPNGERLTCSAAALDQLGRLNWPGNVAQLRRVLLTIIQHRRAGTIELADLPPECRSTSRRVLSPIEALERDAIVNALRDDGGSPTTAARTLGMSRATIYRRIHQYGIALTRSR